METKTIQEYIKRFEPKLESDLIKQLAISLSYCEEAITEQEAIKTENLFVMSSDCVMAVVGISTEARVILSRFCDKDSKRSSPEFNYSSNDYGNSCSYSTEYLSRMINFFKVFARKKGKDNYGGVLISIKNDYPISMENKHFRLVLAPRVRTD